MPRKSKQQRLSEATDLYEQFKRAGIEEGYEGRFIRDVLTRLGANRGISKKQRDWLDSLIERGIPEFKGDAELLQKCDAALTYWATVSHRSWEFGVVKDLRRVVFNNWKMSQKQSMLLERLLNKHLDDVAGNNVFTPSETQHAELEAMVELYNSYAPQWRSERPAVFRAVQRVREYLAGNSTIEEYHYNKLLNAVKTKLNKFKNPRFSAGDMGWILDWNTQEVLLVTSITDVYIDDHGQIVNDWLYPTGEVHTQKEDRVSKRRIKK